MAKLKVAAIQMDSRDDKKTNISKALSLIDTAAKRGAELIVLPEVFNFIGDARQDTDEAELLNGPTLREMAKKCQSTNCWLVAGSILERIPDEEKTYNTSVLINPKGEIVSIYRKIHLFDAAVEDGPTSLESKYRKAGADIVLTEVNGFSLGMAVCYDIRFPEMFRQMALKGAQIIAVSAYFTSETGRAHWHTLLRARAIENQVYIIAANQTGSEKALFPAYGHSLIIDPWGKVISDAQDGEGILVADVDKDYLEQVRKQVPCLTHVKIKNID